MGSSILLRALGCEARRQERAGRAVALLLALGGPACTGGETSIGYHRFGETGTGGGSGGSPCEWSGADGLVAEWHADGDTVNAVPCSPLRAGLTGAVPYGPSRDGEAWLFRSTDLSGADPDFVAVGQTQPFTFARITIDAWVRQLGFNEYPDSNRIVFGTSFLGFAERAPGEAQLYLHENRTYTAWYKTGYADTVEDDWRGCDFPSLGPPEMLAPLDTWLRLTVTYDGAALRCFLNGAVESTAPLAEKEPASESFAPVIGRNYPGDIDALRVFNRALSETEVAAPWP